MNLKVFIILYLVFSSWSSLFAQRKFYVYPPLCDSVFSESAFQWDSSYMRIDCEILSDSVKTFYFKNSVVNTVSVPGWIIIRSYWEQGDEDKFIIIDGIEKEVCLENVDKGFENFIDPKETGEVKWVYGCRRPIVIINTLGCKIYYLERKDLFQLLVSRENNDDD